MSPLRIIGIGAHPDDCEIQMGGAAALWAAQGHAVKLVALSNGDIGHWRDRGPVLAARRRAETAAAAQVLGTTSVNLDTHDGQILPSLELRQTVLGLIREWRADLILTHRPCDYHPDHRYTSILVQDAAYLVAVPFASPVPPLPANPVFAYFVDEFRKPCPFAADVAVAIDTVIEKKLDAIMCMESQFVEGGVSGKADTVPSDPAAQATYRAGIRQRWDDRDRRHAQRFREKLLELYGPARGPAVQWVEAFEICEYGRRPTPADLRQLFPFFD